MTAASTPDPTVSVVIPTHGRPDFLAEALQSVSLQSQPPERVVVVSDDGDERSARLVKDLAENAPYDLVFVDRTDGPAGASASRNLGASLTSTPLLAFLDDDDVWDREYLEKAVSSFSATNTDSVVAPFAHFTDQGRDKTILPRNNLTAQDVFLRFPGVTGSTIVISHSFFDRLGGYDASLPVMNDTDLFLRFLQLGGRYAVLDRELVGVRKHTQGQLTNNSMHRIRGGWTFIGKHEHSFAPSVSRPRKAYQYRMLWRMPSASLLQKAHALLGMARYWSRSAENR